MEYLSKISENTDLTKHLTRIDESEMDQQDNIEINYKSIKDIICGVSDKIELLEKYFILEEDIEISKETISIKKDEIELYKLQNKNRSTSGDFIKDIIDNNIIELDGNEKEIIMLTNKLKEKKNCKIDDLKDYIKDSRENKDSKKIYRYKNFGLIKRFKSKNKDGYKKKRLISDIELPK